MYIFRAASVKSVERAVSRYTQKIVQLGTSSVYVTYSNTATGSVRACTSKALQTDNFCSRTSLEADRHKAVKNGKSLCDPPGLPQVHS